MVFNRGRIWSENLSRANFSFSLGLDLEVDRFNFYVVFGEGLGDEV